MLEKQVLNHLLILVSAKAFASSIFILEIKYGKNLDFFFNNLQQEIQKNQ